MSYPPVLPPEGWYPNPDNHDQQRWWDGHAWTEHVAVGAPMAPGSTPDNPAPHPLGGHRQATQQPQHPQQQYAAQPYAPQRTQGSQGTQGTQGTQGSGYAAGPYAAYPGGGAYPGYSAYPQAPTRGVLSDGTLVAGWWWRVLARVIDNLVLIVPTVVLGIRQIRTIGDVFSDYIDQVQAAQAAGAPTPSMDLMHDGAYLRAITTLGLVYGVVAIVYELLMLRYFSATVGKLVCGLRVRAELFPGPLRWGMVIKRVLGYQVASAVPTVGPLYVLLDVLWPLWDRNKQALHDKLADTAVVHRH